MKTERINFQKFVRNEWREERRVTNSFFIPLPTFESMFLTPEALTLLGVGVVLVGASLYERHLKAKGKDYEADTVSMIVGIVVPTVAIAGAIYVLIFASKSILGGF